MNALRKGVLELAKGIAIFFIALTILLQLVFNKESIIVSIRSSFSIVFLFTLPGSLLLLMLEKISTVQRIIFGTAIGGAIIGILSYYLGIAGFSLPMQVWTLSPVVTLVIFAISTRK